MSRLAPGLAAACLLLAPSCRKHSRQPAVVSEVTVSDPADATRVLRGVFPGPESWRWTAPSFAFSLDPPTLSKPVFLEMDFTVPDELALPVTVTAKINGAEVARKSYDQPGRTTFACPVPASALAQRPATVEFSSDRTWTDPATRRLQGLIVTSAGLKEFEQTAAGRDAEMARSHQAYEQVLKERDLKMPIEKQRELMRVFHDLPIWESLWFRNVRIIKNPLDLWMLQQIAYETQPDFIVETGTWYGGSALWWAHTLNGMGLENSRVLVNLDSDHSMHHVLNELHMYSPMVHPGGYMAVEDTHLDGVPTHPEQGPGPMAAVRQFLSEPEGQAFEQDFSREAMVMTSYPGGFLRRKR